MYFMVMVIFVSSWLRRFL